MLTWEQPWCQPFRDLMAHPKAIPYLNSREGCGGQAVLEPPYYYGRPLIEDDVETLVSPHAEPKDHIPRKRHEL